MRALCLRASLILAALPAVAHTQIDSGRFVSMLNGDTTVVERYTRTATQLTSEIVQKGGGKIKFTARLLPDASVDRFELGVTQGAQSQNAVFTFKGDTMFIEQGSNGEQVPSKVGVVPSLPISFALFEQALFRGKAMGGASPSVPLMRMIQGRLVYGTILKPTADSAVVMVDTSKPLRFKLDAKGRIASGLSETTGTIIARMP